MARYTNIDEYIADFGEDVQALLQAMRETIRAAVPDATEAISYGIPTFKLNGNLVHFAAFKQHIGFYPGGVVLEPEGVDLSPFQEELSAYSVSKGTIRFPLGQPIPFDLVSRITAYRAEQNRAKKKKR